MVHFPSTSILPRLLCVFAAVGVSLLALACSPGAEEEPGRGELRRAAETLFADAHAEGDQAFELYATRAENALADNHRHDLDLREFRKYPLGPPRELYIEWEDRILEEMWAWDRTIEVIERWSASEATRLLAGDEVPIGRLARVRSAMEEAAVRFTRFDEVASLFFGRGQEYADTFLSDASTRLADLHLGFGALLDAKEHEHPSAYYLARANEIAPGQAEGLPDVEEHFSPWLSRTQEQARAAHREQLLEALPEMALNQRRAEAMGQRRVRYLATHDELAELIREAQMEADPALIDFLREFYGRLYSTRPGEAANFAADGALTESWLRQHRRAWDGWDIDSIGHFFEVRSLDDHTYEVTSHFMELINSRGDLWAKNRGLLVRGTTDGGYEVIFPGTRVEQREAVSQTQAIYERRLETFLHEKRIAEAIERARSRQPQDEDEDDDWDD